jgi:hypothetical protein
MVKKSKRDLRTCTKASATKSSQLAKTGRAGFLSIRKQFKVINFANDEEEAVKENQFSVHASSNSSGTLIKQSLVYQNGKKETLAQFIRKRRS